MSYGGAPYPTSYGGTSMPMPNMPSSQHSSFNTPYPAPVNAYPKNTTPYPASTTHNAPYPGMVQNAPTASEIDDGMKQLTDDLVNGVIKSAQNADLQVLIDDDEKLTELISDSQITKDLNKKRTDMADFNKDQATTNLSLKPEFEVLQTTLRELSQKQNELRDRYISLQNKVGSSLSADTILTQLQDATTEQETLSDIIKSSFYDGDVVVDDFIKQFVEGRKLFQLRKIKSEKLKLVLQQQHHPQVGGHNRPGVLQPYMTNQPARYGAPQFPPYPR